MADPCHEGRLDTKELDGENHIGNGENTQQRHELGDVSASNGASNEGHHGVRREANDPAYGLAQHLVAGIDKCLERTNVDLLVIFPLRGKAVVRQCHDDCKNDDWDNRVAGPRGGEVLREEANDGVGDRGDLLGLVRDAVKREARSHAKGQRDCQCEEGRRERVEHEVEYRLYPDALEVDEVRQVGDA